MRNADAFDIPVVLDVGLHCGLPKDAVVVAGGFDSEEVGVF